MQDNKMMKDAQIPGNPRKAYVRNFFQREQGMKEKNLFYTAVSDIKLPI